MGKRPRYWLDSSLFITAEKTMFAFDINASFWGWMSDALDKGTVGAPKKVYEEVVENVRKEDELVRWVKARRKCGLCIEPDANVLAALKKVTAYVFEDGGRYKPAFAIHFVKGADPWIIAYAMAHKGVVVSQETDGQPTANRVRIPDVCEHFGVECIKVWDMLRKLEVRL
jgi:hypothetical protein